LWVGQHGDALEKLDQLTNDITLPADTCNTPDRTVYWLNAVLSHSLALNHTLKKDSVKTLESVH